MIRAVLPAAYREWIEPSLPAGIAPSWWADGDELVSQAPDARIGWFDMFDKAAPLEAVRRAAGLAWLNTGFAGVDWLPLDNLLARKVRLTCGSGLNAIAVAEFAVMAMLAEARGFADLVRAQDRQQWAGWPRRMIAMAGSRALILGHGAIGSAIGRMLAGFDVAVTPVRRGGGAGNDDSALGPGEWRSRLGEFDWVVLALPGTRETAGMIDAAAAAAMKPGAFLVNVGRADTLDQQALAAALHEGRIGGAILDLTDPEPLPPGHPLWACPNLRITMHQAGLPTAAMRRATAERFLANCRNYLAGAPLQAEVDLRRGY